MLSLPEGQNRLCLIFFYADSPFPELNQHSRPSGLCCLAAGVRASPATSLGPEALEGDQERRGLLSTPEETAKSGGAAI